MVITITEISSVQWRVLIFDKDKELFHDVKSTESGARIIVIEFLANLAGWSDVKTIVKLNQAKVQFDLVIREQSGDIIDVK